MFEKLILTDVDGVLTNWDHAFDWWMKSGGDYHVEDPDNYSLHDRYGIKESESRHLVKMFGESSSMSKLPPFRDAIKYVRKLHEEEGFVFHCISAVPNNEIVYDMRRTNLEALFGKTAIERIVLSDTSARKSDFLKEYKDSGCLWIEDVVKNAEIGFSLGLSPLLMSQRHNLSYKPLYHPELKRVNSWKEIYEIAVF